MATDGRLGWGADHKVQCAVRVHRLVIFITDCAGSHLLCDQPSLILIFIRGGNLSVTAIFIFIAAASSQAVVVVVLSCIEHLLCQFL